MIYFIFKFELLSGRFNSHVAHHAMNIKQCNVNDFKTLNVVRLWREAVRHLGHGRLLHLPCPSDVA